MTATTLRLRSPLPLVGDFAGQARGGKLAPPKVGGLGRPFLGRHVVAKLREHGATRIEVVDRDRYDPSTPLRAGSGGGQR